MMMRDVARACVVLFLPAVITAYRVQKAAPQQLQLPPLHHESLGTIPMRMYSKDCGRRRPLALNAEASHVAQQRSPGAGMDPDGIQPFQTVLKDGFFMATCAKDYLLSYGDKFGDGKYSYKLGTVMNVSIVHYTSHVAKEDRQPMTHEVCFEFCRTVPNMSNFGITNGRDCYCAPFFKPMESDSSDCDATCEGNPSQICGGKVKSTLFSMHECMDTEANLREVSAKATTALAALEGSLGAVNSSWQGMQDSAAKWLTKFGAAGDPAASDLMKAAKVFAGELEHTAEAKAAIHTALKKGTTEAESLEGKNFLELATASQAEALTSSMEKLVADAEDAAETLDELDALASPSGAEYSAAANATKQYFPLMYFVDKKYAKMPATCTGKPVSKPMVAVSTDECAHACDAQVESCVGFSFIPSPGGASPSICFLFSKLTEVMYYTECRGVGGESMACMAKLNKFEMTSVRPDPSGRCANCLKKATKAERCP
uniref:WSC domain-containing protein n=1 Tax=Pyrodinium bahamense TaxID=73915 RepID=A0A7S0ADX7_9DINO|mmetsp:Transcript_324/g.821  ORF Transcript_324/g.821 Transcript_324/m.821 type:complete len:486 (+) Transcript_324:64-1521(+)